ncbi:PREDICTED: protoporphyrinogen oxidase [Dufourea novaeangliae]|uniref:Protoporphyrinogen oxidase n=1 Tax=Dufourea novaeangliae TaxID=178035 RepID=A0A154PPL3_DUFNO|nr:PREDICTED: protoporphyrinogen oxidase [Dufourea novaeangliae]KZC13835.1 Protoporphyrinogen oxidase [Dufourea novaeangliae]
MTGILGAGMSGLSAAYYALQNSKMAPIVIFEATNRVGGWVRSIELSDGTIFEQGPRTIRPSGASGKNTLELIEQLKLSDKIIPIRNIHPASKNRLIYSDNELHLLPSTFKGIIKKNSLLNRSLLSLVWNDLRAPKVLKDDESTYSFIERRMGQDVADKVISSMVCGIYAGDAHKISIKSLMKPLFDAEQKHGSIIKGIILEQLSKNKNKTTVRKKTETIKNDDTEINKQLDNNSHKSLVKTSQDDFWAMWGIKGGLEELPRSLAKNITERGVNIKMEHKCEKLKFNKNDVELTVNGEVKNYSRIISSLPAKSLANLVREQHPELSNELKDIPTVTVGVVNLQFSESVLPMKAFGVLIPPKEEKPILGVIFDSCAFPQNSKTTVLTVMMGGAWFEKYFGKCSSEEHLLTVAVNQVKEILHIEEDPKAFSVSILKDCIPQHIVGHMQRLTRIQNYISTHKLPLGLCGSSYQGVSLNDVILSAKQAVSDINSHIL